MAILHSIHSLKYTYYILFASKLKGLVTNININLVISRLVNANASPDVPKPLHRQRTRPSATNSARALRRHDSLRLG
jgi:hypothetical protein